MTGTGDADKDPHARPVVTAVYVRIALSLRNVLVWLHPEVLSHLRRGGRWIDLNQLPFRVVLSWMQQRVEVLLLPWDVIYAQRPIPT
jgi:hypothetical protein